jgi:hypothetical protein
MRIRRDAGLGAAKAAETWTATGPKPRKRRCGGALDSCVALSPGPHAAPVPLLRLSLRGTRAVDRRVQGLRQVCHDTTVK